MAEIERFVKIANPDLPSLDAALSWVVQTIDTENFRFPSVEIQALHPVDEDEPTHYEASVRGNVTTKESK